MEDDTAATPLHVLSRGKVYKAVHFPGNSLEVEISVLCTDDPAVRAPRRDRPTHSYSGNHLEALFERSPGHADSQQPGVEVQVACVKALGICLADSTWVNEISTFSDPFSHGDDASPDADGAPCDAPSPAKPAPADAWSLWNWLTGDAEPPASSRVTWRNGVPHPVVAKQNYQTFLSTDPKEFIPSGTTLRRGEARTFTFTVTGLPSELPPSYGGYALRYCYYVWCCVVWRGPGGAAREHVLKLPFQVWNHAASLRPVRPPRTRGGAGCCWRVRELSRTRQSEASRRAALPSFAENARPRSHHVDARADLHSESASGTGDVPFTPDAHTMSQASASGSVMGELLGDDHLPTVPAEPAAEAQTSAQHHVSSARAIQQLLSLPQQHETLIRHQNTPFLRLVTHGIHNFLGGSVSGVVSSLDNDVCTCVRMSMRLYYDERIPCELFKSGTFVPSPRRGYPQVEKDRPEFQRTKVVQSRTVAEVSEIMLGCEESNFDFPISPSFPPTIYTDKVAVEWNLTFVFYFVPNDRVTEYLETGEVVCEYPIVWQLPLQIHVPPDVKPSCKPSQYVYAA